MAGTCTKSQCAGLRIGTSPLKTNRGQGNCFCFEHILLNYSKGSETSSGNLLVPHLKETLTKKNYSKL